MAITSYLRRLGKSIAMASVETLKDQMPVTAKLFEDNKEEAAKTFKDVTDFRAHSIQLKNITDTFITKPVNLAINNLKKDLKTGDFYNDNGTVDEDTLNALAASLAQEAGYDISDITQLVNTKEEQEQPSSGGPEKPDIDDFARGSLITSSLIGSELQKNTKSIANVLVRTTSASMRTMQDIAKMQYLQNEKQMEITKAGFGSLAHGFNSIIEFNNKAQAVHIQNSIKFYDNVSNNLNTITAIMKEQIEIQRALYKKQDREVDNGLHSDYNKAFQNGGFNLAGYKELLQGRAKNSGAYQLYTLAQGMLPLLTLQLQHPMQFVTKEVIKGLIGTDAKVAMSRFDNSLNGIIQTALAKAADSDSPIARFFGIKQKNLKLEKMNAMYDKGPQPWNGIAQKALVEVIPAFLARIEAGVTGHEERIYDYQSGKFTTLSKAVKYDKQQDILGTNEAMKEMRKELYEIFAPLKMANMKQRKQLHQDIKAFTEGIYRRGYVDVEDIARAIRIGDDKYGGDPNVVRLLLEVTRNMDGAVKANATARINKAKADKMALANFTDFTKQNPMSAVFNNSKSGAFLNSTNKNVGVYSVLKDLPEIRDSRKMSLFDYQYKIYKTLFGISAMMQRMVENGFPTDGGGSGSNRGGGPSGSRPNRPTDGGKFNIYDGFDEDLKTFKQNDRKIIQEREDNKKLARVGLRELYDRPNLTDEEIRKKARLMGISENKLRRDLFRLQFSRSYHDSRLNNMSTLGYGGTGLGVFNGISGPEDQDYGMDLTKLGDNQIHTHAIYQAILGSNGTLKKLKQAHMERDRAANSTILDDIFHIDTKNLPKGVDPNAGFFDKLIQASSVGDKLSIISNGLGSIGQAPSRILARTLTVADTAIYEMLFGKETVTDSKGNKIRGVFGRMIYEIDKAAGGLNEHLNDFFEDGKVKFGNVVDTLQKSITNAGKKFIEEQTGYKFNDVKSLANGLLSHFGLDVDSMAEDAVGNVRQLFGMSKYSKRTQDKRNTRAFRKRMMEIYGDEGKVEELLNEFRADTAGLNMNDKQTTDYLNKADNRRVSKDDDLNDEQEAAYNAQAYGGDSDAEVNLHQYNNKQDKYANNQSTRDRYNRNKHKITFVDTDSDYGDTLESWIKNNIEGHAKGARNVTKGGLAFISEGEAIIPASMNPFNPRRETANDQMNAVNEDRNRINLINRIKSIPGHANGTVDAKSPLSPAQARTKIRRLLAKVTQDTVDETVTNIKDIIMRSYSKGLIDPRNILRDMANGSSRSQRNILNMVEESFDQIKDFPKNYVNNLTESGTKAAAKAVGNAALGEAKPDEGKIKSTARRFVESGTSKAVNHLGGYVADKLTVGADTAKMDIQAAAQLRDGTDLIKLGEELYDLVTSSDTVGSKSKFAAIQNVMDEISQIGTDNEDPNLNEKLNKIIPHVVEICKQLNIKVSDPPSLSSFAPGWLNRVKEIKSVISKVKWLHSVVKAISKKKDEEIGKLLNPRNSYQKRAFWDKKTAAGKEAAKTTLAQDTGLSDINQFIASIFGKDVTAGVNELGKTIKQNLGDIAGGGAIGAALSFALPLGGPLLGAVAGASISLIKNNEALNRKVFGDEKNAGMLPPQFVKFMEKYLPDAKKFGAAGGVAGLLTGFGPLTGAVVGASMTILKNNDTINQALFGKKDKNGKNIDSSSGILSKDRRTAIKKALPKAALMFLPAFFIGGGSLGILGSAAVASGLSMLSSTEAFKSAILGRKDRHGKRRGGLAGAIRQQIINPYRWLFNDFKKASKKWLRDEMFGPLSRGIRPLGRGLFGVFKSVGNFVNKKLKASPFGNKYEKAVNAITGIPKHLTGAIRAAGRGAGAVLSFVPKRIEAAGNALVAREAGKYKGLEYSGRGAGDMLEVLRNKGMAGTNQYRFYQSISTGKKNDEQLRTLAKDFRKFSALGSEDERNAQLKSVLDDAKSRMQGVLEDYNNGLENGEMAMDTNILNGEISIRGKNGKRGYVRGIKGLIDRVARGKMTSDEAIEALDGFNIPTADVKEKFINIIKEAATNTELINNRSKAEATFKEKKNATPLFDALKAAGILSKDAKMEDGDKEWDAAYKEFTEDPSKLAKMSREIDRELQHRASLNKRAEEGDKSAKLDEELQTSTMDYQARALEQGDAELDVLNKILDYVSGKIKNRAEYKALRAPDLVNQAIKNGGFVSVSSDYFKNSLSGRRENAILDEIDRNMDEAGKNIHKANVAHANIKQRDLRAAAKNNFTSKNGIKIDEKDQSLFGNRNITRNKYKFGALQNFADMKGKSGGSVNASAMLKMKLSDESIDAIIYLASVGYPIDAEEMGQIEDATSEGINLLYTLGDLGVDLSDLGRLGSVDKDIAKRVSDLAAAPIIVEKDEKGEVTKVNARGYNILNLGQMIDMVTNEEMMQRTGGDFYHIADKMDQHTIGLLFGNARTSNTSKSISKSNKYKRNMSEDFAQRREDRLKEIATKNDDVSTKSPDYAKYGKEEAQTSMNAIAKALSLNDEVASSASKDLNKLLKLIPAGKDSEAVLNLIAKHVKSDPVMMDQLADLAGTNLVNKSIDEDAVNNLIGKLLGKVKSATGHAFGISSFMSKVASPVARLGSLFSSTNASSQQKQESKSEQSEDTKPATPAENAAKANVTSKDVAASSAAISAAVSANSARSASANAPIKPEGKKGKKDTTYVADADGDSKEMTTNAYGELVEVHNKHNEEIKKKNKFKLKLQERSTAALEAIAAKIGAANIKGTAKKVAGSLGDLFKDIFSPFGQLKDFLCGLPLVGPLFALVFSKMFKGVKSLGKGIFNLGKNAIKWAGNKLLQKGLATKFGQAIAKVPGMIAEKVSNGLFGMLKNMIPHKGIIGGAAGLLGLLFGNHMQNTNEDGSIAHGAGSLIKSIGAGTLGYSVAGKLFDHTLGKRLTGTKGAVARSLLGSLASGAASDYVDDGQMSLGSTLTGMGTSLALDGGLAAGKKLIGKTKFGKKLANSRFGKLLGIDAPEEENTDTPAEGEEGATGQTNDILSKIEENTRAILNAITNKNSDTTTSDDSSSDDDSSTLQDLAENAKDKLTNKEDSEDSKETEKGKEESKETEKGKETTKDKETKEAGKEGSKETEKGKETTKDKATKEAKETGKTTGSKKKGRFGKVKSIAGSIGRRAKGLGKVAAGLAVGLGGSSLVSSMVPEGGTMSKAMDIVSDATDVADTSKDMVSIVKNGTDLNDAKNDVQNIKDAALNTTEAADEGVKGSLVAKLKEGITGVINKISSIVPGKGSAEKIKAFGARLLKKCTTPEYLARAARKMARQASAAVTSSTGIGVILGIGITLYGVISDFQHGYSSADSILGVPDGSTSMGMKIMCGVITALWSAIPVLGFLIDSDEITKFAIQELGPMFGFTQRDIDDLKKGKKDQDKNNSMDSSANDQKANKITDAIKNSWESIKNNPAAAFTAGPLGLAVYGANQFANLVKNGAHAVGNATSSLWKSAKEAGKNAMAWFNQSADSVRQSASGALDWLANKGNSFKDSIIGGAASLGAKAWNGLKSIGSTIADAGKSGWNTFTNFTSSVASKFGFGKHSMFGTGGFYSQLDPAYAMPYNTASDTEPQSMRDSGCGPVAASNALSSLGIDVDPRISAEYALKGNYKERNGGTFPSFFEHMFKDAGVDASYLHTHQDIKDSLAKGDPVVLMGKDPNGESNNSPFAENPHYVTATGLDENGNIIVQDPETNTPNKTYDPSMLDKTSYAISARSKHFGSGKMANTLKSKLGRGVDKVSSKISSIYNSIRNSRFGRSKYGRGEDLKAKMWALADWVAQQLHTDKKFVYAQWYNESGGFDSPCAKNNFAGISSPDGGWMNFDTPEEFASYFANIVAKGWPKCCNTSTIDDYGKGLQYPDDKQPYCTDPPGDGYINAIKENMKSCPNSEPNKSLIDTSKLYFKGKVSGSPNNNSNGSNTKPKSKSFMSAFANVASILSSAVSGGADDSKSSGNNTNSGGSNAINGDKKQNAKQIWDFLKGKGLTNVQIAAIMGNIEAESEYNPSAVNSQSGAKGICQWLGDRADKLDALAAQQNKNWSDLSVQLDYLWQEISTNKSDYPLPESSDVNQAVIEWEKTFERSEDTNSYNRRRQSANAALSTFGQGKFKNGTKYGKGIKNFIASKFNKKPKFGQSKRRLAKFGMGDDINWNVIESNHPGDDVSTNFSNLQPYVKSALNDFASKYYQAHNEKLLVTGGAETVDVNGNPVHADGQWSHHTGWKTDITTDLTNEDIAILRAMGASVNLEGDHYDIDWSGHDSRDLNPIGQQKTANGGASSYSGGSNGSNNQQAAAPAKDYTGGFFDKLAGVASKMAGPVKQLMAAFNKGVMGAAGSVFGNSLKFIFGDDNPFSSILGFGDDSNGGSGGGGSNGNGTFVPSSNPKINEAMKYADEVVASKKNYGDNGCVRWANDFLQHANIPDTGGESVSNVIQISKSGNYYKWKDPSEGALPGDICVFGPSPDGNHVGIADGAGGMWDVSSQAGHVVLHRSINDTFPNALLGYVATGGDGKGNVAAPSTQTKSEEEMRKDMGSSNAAKGKHSQYGTGKYGRGGFSKFFKKVKNFGKKVWTGIKKFGKNILNSNTKFNNTRKKSAEDSLYTQIKAPNGLMYTENDIKYLMSANKDLTREQAIQLLSKADKYTKDLTAPNGKKYTQNDIEYLMKNGYDFGAAIDLLSGSRKYDGMSDKEAKKSFMKSYNKDVKDNNNFNTTFTTNNLPSEYQYHYKGATYSKGLNLASDIAAKGKHSQYGMGGFSRFFKKAKKFGSKVWSGIKNFFKGFRNSVVNTKKNPVNDLYTDKVAPNGLKYSKNDIKYLLDSNKGMKEEEAIQLLSKADKYTKDLTAPNGTKYSQNDIEYLMKNGYTFKDAIDLLSQQKKYTEITEEQKETSARDNSKKVFLKNYNSDLLGSTTSLNNPLPTEYQYHKEGFRSNGIDGLSAKGKHRYGMGDDEVVSIPYGENTDYQASYTMDPTVAPKSTTTPIKHFGANSGGSSLEDKLDKLIQLQAQNNNIINAILKVAMEYIKANAGAGSRQVMDPNTKNTMSVSNSNAAIISSLLSAINGASTTMNGDFGSIGSTDFNDATLIGKTMDAISTR